MSGSDPVTVLHGRTDEQATIDALLDAIRRGESRSLVLRGEAGIGKTALLEYMVASASDCTVVRAEGVESEMQLAYASLHQLYSQLPDRLDKIPAPQREALQIAFGETAGASPDRFLVGLALLSVLSEVADERPVVCVIDDAQWLDQASALTLAFVARRLLAEPLALVFAAREPGDALAHVPDLELRGLRNGDATTLLGTSVPFVLDERVRDRIIAETHGNPLALLELPRGLTSAELAGGFGIVDIRGLPERIEEGFVRRLEELPWDARQLLLLAAAEPLGDPLLLRQAARRLGIDFGVAAAVEYHGLVTIQERVIFRHPLVRSAIYRSVQPDERRAVHLALAAVTNAESEPDRRAWHLGAAASGADEDVAAELERSAVRAQARGGVAAAAAFLQRAAALTPDPATRLDRSLAAAQASLEAGRFTDARALLATAEAGPLDDGQRARTDLVRAQLAFASRRGVEATQLLLSAAQRLEALDVSLARETYVDAFSSALFGARLSGAVGVPEVAAAARAAPRAGDDPSTADLLLDALVGLSDNYESAVPMCRTAVLRLLGTDASHKERLRWLWQGCVIALEIWDDASADQLSHQSVEIARETGTLSELALALSARTPMLVFSGELSAASATVAETASVQDASGIASAPYGALILGAWQGKANETRQLIELTLGEAVGRGEGIGVAICDYARAVLCNGMGDYEAALSAAHSASEHREVVAENWGLSELVEPATRTGRTDLATEALARLTSKARASGSLWALGIQARSRALLSAGDEADSWFRQAISQLNRTRVRAELARTHLLYGEWLRREKRRADARAQLRTAHELFSSLGMQAFSDRARRELSATGETARARTVLTRDDLTPQEGQIARMAIEGLSNPEIGARLFLSPRTVEYHLRQVFGKLDIQSRHQLADALPAPNITRTLGA